MKRSGSCLPKFEQIKREIEDRIRKGFFRHGDTLPPENELAQLFNAGRNTIRRAVELLEKDSLIIKQQGRVSRINLPGETSAFRSVKANHLAYFTNYLPAMINHNMVYMDLFRHLIESAARHDLAVDFFSTDAPNSWTIFQQNRSRYLGAFSVGISRSNVSRGVFERLESIEGLIALDELEDLPARYCISVDNFDGGRKAAHHLVKCGCRNIVMLHLAYEILPFRLRREGFAEEMKNHPEINYEFRSLSASDIFLESGSGCLDELYSCIKDADGVFCYCDLLALQVLNAAYYHKLQVPCELSVVGFDGIAIGQHTTPRLTSVVHPAQSLADQAVLLATKIYDHTPVKENFIYIPGKFQAGETTRILSGANKGQNENG